MAATTRRHFRIRSVWAVNITNYFQQRVRESSLPYLTVSESGTVITVSCSGGRSNCSSGGGSREKDTFFGLHFLLSSQRVLVRRLSLLLLRLLLLQVMEVLLLLVVMVLLLLLLVMLEPVSYTHLTLPTIYSV